MLCSDFDPEEDAPPADTDEESDADVADANAGREHYFQVGKSKLRKRDIVPLGPQYEGSKVSRTAMMEEDEEDDPFNKGFDDAESEEEVDGQEDMDGEEDESEADEDGDLQDGEESPATDISEEEDEDEDMEDREKDAGDDRSELRRIMAEEQKSVAATLSQAAKADAEKGRAVKQQRKTFDSLLGTRIKLQKALIATNTMTGLSSDPATPVPPANAFEAAEKAVFSFWSSLNNLREELHTRRTSKKRTHAEISLSTPTADLWSHMRTQESNSQAHLNSILSKWSVKARGAASLEPRNRLNNSATQQTIVDVLHSQLADSSRLVKRARTPRSCAPLQLSRKVSEDARVYDDADFYGLLLQSLLEQRSADSVASASHIDVSFQMRREAKTKKNVDTKASKGRKLRYTVHEKLQNFMAPEDRGTWADRQVDELFGSLLGRSVGLGEEEVEEEGMDGIDVEEAGLSLFRSG